MAFLLEQNERWFEKQLQAHLLEEGCNLPMPLAKASFYKHMLSELREISGPEYRSKLQTLVNGSLDHASNLTHPLFHNTIRFCASKHHDSGRRMALAVTKTIQAIVGEWQLPPEMFQEDLPSFSERVCSLALPLWEKVPSVPFEIIRQRLYLSLTTSLLSKMNVRQEFEREFGSIPELLQAMQTDHARFCRFMNFCREHTPYFQPLVSRSFWRTLETLHLEQRNESSGSLKLSDG